MSEVHRGKRGYRQRGNHNWRPKRFTNKSTHKYTRVQFLEKFADLQMPNFENLQYLGLLLQDPPTQPHFHPNQPFSHTLGSEINSRKPPPKRPKKQEEMPEWYDIDNQPPPMPPKQDASQLAQNQSEQPAQKQNKEIKYQTLQNVRNLPQSLNSIKNKDLEEDFSKIDIQYEQKIKQEQASDEEIPEWDDPGPIDNLPPAPTKSELSELPWGNLQKYSANLLLQEIDNQNPFAYTIFQSAKPDQHGFICPLPNTQAYQRVWWYKDPHGQIQGPFTSVEMFNWCIQNYFPQTLPVAFGNTNVFAPLNTYTIPGQSEAFSHSPRATQNDEYSQEFPVLGQPAPKTKVDQASTSKLKSMLGIDNKPKKQQPQPKKGWGPKQNPVARPLTEIQKEQAKNSNRQ